MKTLFEAASVIVLIAVSQLAFGTTSTARPVPDSDTAMTSNANASQADSNGHGQLVKPLSL